MKNTSISRLFAGTSALALTFGLATVGASLADHLIIDTDGGAVSIDADKTFVKIEGADRDSITNNAEISPGHSGGAEDLSGDEDAIGIWIDEASDITGSTVNNGLIDIDVMDAVSGGSGDGDENEDRRGGGCAALRVARRLDPRLGAIR